MIDEHKALKAKERGIQADALIRNELYQETWKTIEAEIIKKWAGTGPDQGFVRENLWQALQLLSDFQQIIKGVATNGKIAQGDLDELANKFRPRAA